MAIKANFGGTSVTVQGREGQPVVVDLPQLGLNLVGGALGEGGYACRDQSPAPVVEVDAGIGRSIRSRTERRSRVRVTLKGF